MSIIRSMVIIETLGLMERIVTGSNTTMNMRVAPIRSNVISGRNSLFGKSSLDLGINNDCFLQINIFNKLILNGFESHLSHMLFIFGGFANLIKGEKMAREENKKSRISDRWIPAGVLAGVGLGMLVFGFTYNPFAVPGLTLIGLGVGFALSIVLRKNEREK